MPESTTKPCSKCGEVKPLSEFYVAPLGKDGHRTDCRDCSRARARHYHETHPDVVATYTRVHRADRAAYAKKWRAANPEREKANRLRQYRSDPERYRAYQAKWQRENVELQRFMQKRWRNSHRSVVKAHNKRRWHQKRANGGSFTQQEWDLLCAQYDHRCLCCGQRKKLTVDHITPVIKGGRGDISNLQPLCLRCNIRKGAKIIDYRPEHLSVLAVQMELF